MLKTKKSVSLVLLFVLLAVCSKSWAQRRQNLQSRPYEMSALYVFDKDSLAGFDEDAARKNAISEKFLGAEFKIRMFQLKRGYINAKYGLYRLTAPTEYVPDLAARNSVVPGCTNEDFEASTSGFISSNNAINGWVLSGGTNLGSVGGSSVNSCNLLGCCNQVTSESAIRSTPFVDPLIGSQYPIYSVFGTVGSGSTAAAAANPQVGLAMGGNKIIRINDSVNDYSIEKLSKTFAVTANNALFQFAFISVFYTGHPCCDAGSFRIKLYAAGSNTPLACPAFSVAAPSQDCSGSPTTPNYLNAAQGNGTTGAPIDANSSLIYNRWQISSIDLTPYISSNITIEIILTDCTGGGHFGYCYFDAQCGPMTIYGNGTPYAAGNTTASVPTCGSAGATLCAVEGLGPYSWAGPGVGPPYTTPSNANQCFVTNLSGTFTLSMTPPGSCTTLTRSITSTITPAPLLNGTAHQATCGGSLAVITITPSGSAANPSQLIWSPTPAITPTTALSNTYVIPGGPASNIVTITAVDPLGCKITITPTINPAPPIPTFTVFNVTGSQSITCAQAAVHLTATTSYTYGTLSYTWNSPGTYSAGINEILAYTPGVYTVTAMDPVSLCTVSHTYAIYTNTTAPTGTVTPALQNITCLVPAVTVSASALPTINIMHHIYSPQGQLFSATSHTTTYVPGSPGIYTDSIIDMLTGCYVVKQFNVTSSDNFPLIDVASTTNYTVGCASHSLTQITLGGTTTPMAGGAVTYTILTPGFTATNYITGGVSVYTLTTPGTYTAVVEDGSSHCRTTIPFSVVQNIQGPNVGYTADTTILSCYQPTAQLTATTTNGNTFSWTYPGPNGTNVTTTNPFLIVNTTTNVASTTIGTYTLSITSNMNGCTSTTTLTMRQNLAAPIASVVANASLVTCKNQTVQLTNFSHTGIQAGSGFPSNLIIQVQQWDGPPPQAPTQLVTNYIAATPGMYTMTVKDLNNGCTSKATYSISDNRVYPVVNTPSTPTIAVIDCGAINTTITVKPDRKDKYTYTWEKPNPNARNEVRIPSYKDPVTGDTIKDPFLVQDPGIWHAYVTNTVTGCMTSAGTATVITGSLTAQFAPSQVRGYAPLTVNFSNGSTSTGASGTSSITTVWSFGNGTQTTTPANVSPSAVYTQPGTYTVTIYSQKGVCQATSVQTISVDVPSKLTVPNVFTPNGDGVNDYFFLKTANLTDITAGIYDRWGHKVYELESSTGNILWDGNTLEGKKAAAGTYFYIIKAKGKDDKDYDQKGIITLYR